MGGEHDRLTAAEAASVLGWWIEAGVDVAVQDTPRAWLGAPATRARGGTVPPHQHPKPPPRPSGKPRGIPQLARRKPVPSPRQGQCSARASRGREAAEVMLLADMPTPEDVAEDQPIAGQAWELTERMLAAIGFTSEQAYVAQPYLLPQPRNAPFRRRSRSLRRISPGGTLRSPSRSDCCCSATPPAGPCSASHSPPRAVTFTKLKGCARYQPSIRGSCSTVRRTRPSHGATFCF